MKRIYIAPETRTLCLHINQFIAVSQDPPTGYYYDENGNLVPIGTGGNPNEDDDNGNNSRYLKSSMWDEY